MLAHVAANVALAHPVQRTLQEVLPVRAALDVGAPLLDVRVLAVAELSLRKRHERPGVDSIQELLGLSGTPAMLIVSNHCLISVSVPSHS